MLERNLAAYVVPGTDPHLSEYLTGHWQTREWCSGFSGTAGLVVITAARAALWTDGRYYLQAEQQLRGSGIELMRQGEPGVPDWQDWLRQELQPGDRLGVNGRVFSVNSLRELAAKLDDRGIILDTSPDLVAELWDDRPPLPLTPVELHALEYTGEGCREKLSRLRELCAAAGADSCLVTKLDDIAWLLNIRGSDIDYLPVVHAWVLVTSGECLLCIDDSRLTEATTRALAAEGVTQRGYDEIVDLLSRLDRKTLLLVDPHQVNQWLWNAIGEGCRLVEAPQPLVDLKSRKNEVQIAGMKNSQLKDGIALVKFLCWLEQAWREERITEIDAAERLEALRREQPLYRGPAFKPISAWGPHAAMMHYAPTAAGAAELRAGFYLFDTGGQYLDGTTDITRTVALGEIPAEAKRDFTLVLKGHIALARAVFLSGARGSHLDVLARLPLWEQGIDYKCGTGHGLGQYLSVHEEPQRFWRKGAEAVLEPGMFITNEPGIYREGKYGIRLENDLLVVPAHTTADGEFLRFENVTHCPIDLNAIDPGMLTELEIEWLNDYHRRVQQTLSPHLEPLETEWLACNTKPL